MKIGRLIKTFAVGTVLAASMAASAQWVQYGGRDLNLNPEPIREGGNLMLPARATADAIGARIAHDGRNARFTWRNNTVEYSPGDNDFYLNGRRRSIGGRSYERRGVLYVPSNLFEDLTNNELRLNRDRWPRDDRNDRDRWPRDDRDRNPRWPDDRNDRIGDNVYFNDRALRFPRGQEPFRSGGTLLVPVRETTSLVGARIERPGNGNRVILRYGRNEVVYDGGRSWYRINGRQVNLPTASRDRNGVLFVPVQVFDALTGGRLSTNRR